MKPRGTKVEYEQERNTDLMQAYRKLLMEFSHISMPLVYAKLVNMPSKRFWVSEERACIVISKMQRGDKLSTMLPMKRAMFREIFRRVTAMQRHMPSEPLSKLVAKVVLQPADKFYLTPGSAKVIISKARKQWYEERRKRLRHMF